MIPKAAYAPDLSCATTSVPKGILHKVRTKEANDNWNTVPTTACLSSGTFTISEKYHQIIHRKSISILLQQEGY